MLITSPSEADDRLVRERPEGAMGAAVIDPAARRIHPDVAGRYAERARTEAAGRFSSGNETEPARH